MFIINYRQQNCQFCSGGAKVQVIGHRSQVTGHRLQVTGHRLQVTGHRLQVTGHRSQVKKITFEGYALKPKMINKTCQLRLAFTPVCLRLAFTLVCLRLAFTLV